VFLGGLHGGSWLRTRGAAMLRPYNVRVDYGLGDGFRARWLPPNRLIAPRLRGIDSAAP
jgi:hypothetical protein